MPERRGRDPVGRWLKRGAMVASVVPAGVYGARAATGGLGANPIAELLNGLGYWALVWLLASLASTPVRLISGWAWPLKIRKTLGLAAFFYASLHFAVYVAVDQGLDLHEILDDIVKRKFMTIGFAAWLILLPLALTSPNRMLKRLGARRWRRLHRLVYVAAGLAVIHFVWRVKSDLREPLIFGAVLLVLLAVRVGAWLRTRSQADTVVAAR